MRPRQVRRRLTLLAVGAILAGTITGTGLARADTVDDAFIAALDEQQITYPTRAYAIAGGHQICAELDGGTSINTVVSGVASASYLGMYDAGYLVGASIGAYCPWHAKEAAA